MTKAMVDELPHRSVDIVKLAYYDREEDARRAVEAITKGFGTSVEARAEKYSTTETRVMIFKIDATLTWKTVLSVITAEFHPKLEICQRKEAEVDCYPEPPVAATAAPLLLVVQMMWMAALF